MSFRTVDIGNLGVCSTSSIGGFTNAIEQHFDAGQGHLGPVYLT